MKVRQIIVFLLVVCALFISTDLLAQCPMCKAAAESNLKAGGGSGRGLNAGILYMLSAPYVIVMTLGIIWYKKVRKSAESLSVE